MSQRQSEKKKIILVSQMFILRKPSWAKFWEMCFLCGEVVNKLDTKRCKYSNVHRFTGLTVLHVFSMSTFTFYSISLVLLCGLRVKIKAQV